MDPAAAVSPPPAPEPETPPAPTLRADPEQELSTGAPGSSQERRHEPVQAAAPIRQSATERGQAASDEQLAAPALSLDTRDARRVPILLLVSLLIAIGLLAIATAPPTIARRRGGLAATALGFRAEIATCGALLLMLTAVGFFLTA